MVTVAEEEGFDFVQYKGGTRWHALVCYSRMLETKDLRFLCINTAFPRS
jgi:hypothetical protein